MGWCITERVKRLADNEIELCMKIPTMECRASNIPMTKAIMYVVITVRPIKDLCRICRSQYGYPASAIGYWPERCLGHVYIVLKPVRSACLTFDDDFVLYELCDLVTECCSESRMRSHTWREVSKWLRGKDSYIGRWYSNTRSVLGVPGTYRVTGRGSGHPPPAKIWALMGQGRDRPAPKGLVRPLYGLAKLEKEMGRWKGKRE